MRSYAANRRVVSWKVRLPASLPYLFTALKITATASIVGAIIGEGPGGVPDGLGRAIINFNQQYISGPEKLWATIFVSALVWVAFYLVVRLAELCVPPRPHAAIGRREHDEVTGTNERAAAGGPGSVVAIHGVQKSFDVAGGGRTIALQDIDLEIRPASSCPSSGRPAAASRRCCGSSAT